MIKAIILDCFGVLVGRGFEETYRTAGGDPVADRDFIDDMLAQTNRGMISEQAFYEAMADKLGITQDQWQAAMHRVEQPNVGLLDYARQLRQTYKLAVLSNANEGVIESKIGKDRVVECFDEIVVSAAVGLVKPDPDIYRYTADKLGVELEECVFIDDSESHLVPARELGMKTILYKDFVQTRGELEKILSQS